LGRGHDERDNARHRAAHPCRPARTTGNGRNPEGCHTRAGISPRDARSARQHQGQARLRWCLGDRPQELSARPRKLPRRDIGLSRVGGRAAGRHFFTEGLTRTNVNQGPVWVTFTPLLGMSETVRRFLLEKSPDRDVTTMTLDDVEHFTAEEKAKIAASYSAHEREARTKGVPTLGSGR